MSQGNTRKRHREGAGLRGRICESANLRDKSALGDALDETYGVALQIFAVASAKSCLNLIRDLFFFKRRGEKKSRKKQIQRLGRRKGLLRLAE